MLTADASAAMRLRSEMGKARLTQKGLADSLNVSVKKASDLMSGTATWRLRDLDAVSRLFGVPREDFVAVESDEGVL